jgi:transposase-like protein
LTPTEVVRKHGISSGQLYTWRQQLLSGAMTMLSRAAPGFAQVDTLPARQPPEASDPQLAEPGAASGALSPSSGVIEMHHSPMRTLRDHPSESPKAPAGA